MIVYLIQYKVGEYDDGSEFLNSFFLDAYFNFFQSIYGGTFYISFTVYYTIIASS